MSFDAALSGFKVALEDRFGDSAVDSVHFFRGGSKLLQSLGRRRVAARDAAQDPHEQHHCGIAGELGEQQVEVVRGVIVAGLAGSAVGYDEVDLGIEEVPNTLFAGGVEVLDRRADARQLEGKAGLVDLAWADVAELEIQRDRSHRGSNTRLDYHETAAGTAPHLGDAVVADDADSLAKDCPTDTVSVAEFSLGTNDTADRPTGLDDLVFDLFR